MQRLDGQVIRLSPTGKGCLLYTAPEDWDYTLKGLSLINREKIDAIREAIKELERAGYIVRSRERLSLIHIYQPAESAD